MISVVGERRRAIRVGEIFKYIFIFFICFLSFGPFIWLFITSFKDVEQIFNPGDVLPKSINFANYTEILEDIKLGVNFYNSFVIAAIRTFLVVVMGAMAGYGLSRFRFKGNGVLLMFVLLIRLVPPITILIPLYVFIRGLGLVNTKAAMVILYLAIGLPTVIWICKVFFDQLPQELFDAAKIDGCKNWYMLVALVVPLSGAALAVTGILMFTSAWNEFLLANTFTLTPRSRTLPVAVMPFVNPTADTGRMIHWGHGAAGTIMAIWPVILMGAVFQKYLVRGIMVGSIKG
jgi:multiple sugar transport system permease protein